MLSAGAYSFRQQSRLAISLSWVGGFVNVVALLATAHVVSHTTGNTTLLGERLIQGKWMDVLAAGSLLLCFLLGAMLSAVMTQGTRRRGNTSNYILPVAAEAALLMTFAGGFYFYDQNLPENGMAALGLGCVAAMAMGLQNATITRISGSVVRTTHLTGVFTDLGIGLVQLFFWWKDRMNGADKRRALRLLRVTGRHPLFLRAALLVSIIGSFFLGAMAGTLAYLRIPGQAMCIPIAFLLWIIFEDLRRPIADVREIDPLADPDLGLGEWVRELLPREIGIYRLFHRRSSHHRAPNFQRWARMLPPRWEVVVLIISPMTQLDTNAAMDLRTAAEALQAQRRQLVIAGLNGAQFQVFIEAGMDSLIGRHNLCSDLEYALARALAVHEEMRHKRTSPGQGSSSRHVF